MSFGSAMYHSYLLFIVTFKRKEVRGGKNNSETGAIRQFKTLFTFLNEIG